MCGSPFAVHERQPEHAHVEARDREQEPLGGQLAHGVRRLRLAGGVLVDDTTVFAKLARFHRALRAAHDGGPPSWASIAAAVGYYDQAHLIADFRAIAGTTPAALLRELRAAPFATDPGCP